MTRIICLANSWKRGDRCIAGINPIKGERVGKVQPTDLLKYASNDEYILHNDLRYVTVPYMQSLPVPQRQTLQLVKAVTFKVKVIGQRFEGSDKWEGCIVTPRGKNLTATITDPVFTRRLELGHRPGNPCLVTVSLSMPWQPENWEKDEPCWKLIAGVVELPEGVFDDEIPF